MMAKNPETQTVLKKPSVDWAVTVPVVILIVAFCAFIVAMPETASKVMGLFFSVVTGSFGFVYQGIVIFCALACIWLIFGPLANKRLGEGKQMSTFSWLGMMFGGACSCSIMYWATIEYLYYVQAPPFGVEPYSVEALRWGAAYGPFHWGIMPFTMYAFMAVIFGFYLYVRKPANSVCISDACTSLIGEKRAKGFLGKVIDTLYILPLILLHAGVSLGLSTPLVGSIFSSIFGIEHTLAVDAGLIVAWTVLFTLSVYGGLTKGMKFITDLKMWLITFILLFVFCCGPTSYIINNALESLGTQLQYLPQMVTYTSAADQSGFAQNWTIFYFAWFFSTILGNGMYYAQVCRGRTVRKIVIGVTTSNAVFCMMFFWIIGNFSMDIYLQDILPIEEMMAADPNGTVVQIWTQLPIPKIIIPIFFVYCFIATWGAIQSAGYLGAMAGTKNLSDGQEPPKYIKIFWTILLGTLCIALLFLGGLETVKSSAMMASVLTLIVFIVVMIALSKDIFKIWGPDIRGRKKVE